MKSYLFALTMVAAVLCGCVKEENQLKENVSRPAPGDFTCTIENDGTTKTTLDGELQVIWENGNQILINGVKYATESTSSTATFSAVGSKAEAFESSPYYIAFFANGTTEDCWDEGNARYKLPASYTYVSYSDGIFNMPMYAQGDDNTLEFKNICSVIKVGVTTSSGLSFVRTVTVTSTAQINGAFDAAVTEDPYDVAINFAGGQTGDEYKKITVTLPDVALDGSTPVYFYVPVAPGSQQLTVTVSDGTSSKSITMKENVTLVRNKIYGLAFPAYSGGSGNDAI